MILSCKKLILWVDQYFFLKVTWHLSSLGLLRSKNPTITSFKSICIKFFINSQPTQKLVWFWMNQVFLNLLMSANFRAIFRKIYQQYRKLDECTFQMIQNLSILCKKNSPRGRPFYGIAQLLNKIALAKSYMCTLYMI